MQRANAISIELQNQKTGVAIFLRTGFSTADAVELSLSPRQSSSFGAQSVFQADN
jgi:hypothetical protein